MKFGKYLDSHSQYFWNGKYLSYKLLKKYIKNGHPSKAKNDSVDDVDERRPLLDGSCKNQDFQFIMTIHQEIAKIETHFCDTFSQYSDTCRILNQEVDQLEISPFNPFFGNNPILTEVAGVASESSNEAYHDHHNCTRHLSQRYKEIYKNLNNLKEYQQLNNTGLFKILKKYDKINGTTLIKDLTEQIANNRFTDQKPVDDLLAEIEGIYAETFHAGDRKQALKDLRPSKIILPEKGVEWRAYRIGLFSGVILLITFYEFIKERQYSYKYELYPLFRGLAYPLVIALLFALNMHVWKRYGINHHYVFEINFLTSVSPMQIVEIVGILATILSSGIFFFKNHLLGPTIAAYMPLITASTMLLVTVNPFPILFHKSRIWLLKLCFRILLAPFFTVNFADFWLADQLVSLGAMLLDWEQLFCYYISLWSSDSEYDCTSSVRLPRILLGCLPSWIRFCQCLRRFYDTRCAFPHLVNAGKYSTSIFAVLFWLLYTDEQTSRSSFEPGLVLFVSISVVQTIYAFAYDILMDWGLHKRQKKERVEHVTRFYPTPLYYSISVLDAIFRTTWTLKFCKQSFMPEFWFHTIISTIEIIRRFLWNFLRIENEYVKDCKIVSSIISQEAWKFEVPVTARKDEREETYAYARLRNNSIANNGLSSRHSNMST